MTCCPPHGQTHANKEHRRAPPMIEAAHQPSTLLVLLAIVILALAIGQTFQISALNQDMRDAPSTTTTVSPRASPSPAAPTRTTPQAPQMVGGC